MEQEILFIEKGNLQGFKVLPGVDPKRVIIRENGSAKLDLNISGTTIAVASSGVDEGNAHEWLWGIGMKFLEKHDFQYTKILVTSDMVLNGELIVPWEAVIKEQR
ncbi:hypothetical protein J1TS1_16350 [Shouchella clausii]|uniref:Uncharacterized protein n=2 Tax=Shouchella TaxID=2893057 RepID=A0A268P3I8_SHOCL|nr:hypothetical protein [Shouchella clausii]PAE90334.1 hypothetical protein CHH72_04970 [Shouchella clausii]GIN07490.1 hypothetical protein J1TS1_16350 [Shouchella clausii]